MNNPITELKMKRLLSNFFHPITWIFLALFVAAICLFFGTYILLNNRPATLNSLVEQSTLVNKVTQNEFDKQVQSIKDNQKAISDGLASVDTQMNKIVADQKSMQTTICELEKVQASLQKIKYVPSERCL